MTRHTQSQAPEASGPRPPDGTAVDPLRAAEAAAALIELAVRESQLPVGTLGDALERISRASTADDRPAAADISACIESLQFHDRMIQQLRHVRDLLVSVSIVESGCGHGRDWPALRETLRSRFTTDSHRLLFNLLMPAEADHDRIQLHAEEGNVELF